MMIGENGGERKINPRANPAHPYITERLLMGRKESNQTNKNYYRQLLKKSMNRFYSLNPVYLKLISN